MRAQSKEPHVERNCEEEEGQTNTKHTELADPYWTLCSVSDRVLHRYYLGWRGFRNPVEIIKLWIGLAISDQRLLRHFQLSTLN